MKKVAFWLVLFYAIGLISFGENTEPITYMVIRTLPASVGDKADPPQKVWLSGKNRLRIDYAPRPGSTGFWTTLIRFPDIWSYNPDIHEGYYIQDDDSESRFSPAGYNDTLRKLRYGHELEFLQANGFNNCCETLDGHLCSVWDAFADGYLATLYVNQSNGLPFQLEFRQDNSSCRLVKKIRYDEYVISQETGVDLFAVPSNVVWTSHSIPPKTFTNRTELVTWLQNYYQHPDAERAADALVAMNYYQLDRNTCEVVFYYLFKDNPERVGGWIKNTEDFRSATRQAALEALWLVDSKEGLLYLQSIIDTPEHHDHQYVADISKKNRYTFLELPVTDENVPDLLINAFRMTGDPAFIRRLFAAVFNLQNGQSGTGFSAAVNAVKLLVLETETNPAVLKSIKDSSSELTTEQQQVLTAFDTLTDRFHQPSSIPTNSPLTTALANRNEAEFLKNELRMLWEQSGGAPDKAADSLFADYSLNFARSQPIRCYELIDENRELDRRIKEKLAQYPNNIALLWMKGELYGRSTYELGLGDVEAQSVESLQQVYSRIEKQSGGAALLAFICAERLADYFEKKNAAEAAVWQTNSLNSAVYLIEYGGFSGADRRIAAKHLRYAKMANKKGDYLSALYDQIAHTEHGDPWLCELIAGDIKTAEAWAARGNDYAEYVSRDMTEGFKARLWEARNHLIKAWALEPGFPEAAAEMITVCMGEGKKEELRTWFDRAVALQLDDVDAYSHYRYAIWPRWYGSHRQIFELGKQAFDTHRFDTLAPQQYLNSLYDIEGEIESTRDLVQAYPEVYSMVKEFHEKTPALPLLYEANTFSLGRYAWGARDYKTAETALNTAVHKYQNQTLRRIGGWPMLLGEAMLANSDQGLQARQAFALEVRGRYDEAEELYKQILKNPTLEKTYVYSFVRDRAEQMRIRANLESGEWFDITPPADMAGWTATAEHTLLLGKWKRSADNWIVGTPVKQDARLLCNVPVGDAFELKGEFDLGDAERLGIIFGYSSVLSQRQCTILIDEKSVALSRAYFTSGMKKAPAQINKGINTFHLQVWKKRVTLYINEQKVLSDVEPGKDWWGRGEGQFGLADSKINNPTTKLKYRNLQLRQLAADPATALEGLLH
jgi:hypothetical protein